MFENRNKLESTIHIPLKEKIKGLIKKKKKKILKQLGKWSKQVNVYTFPSAMPLLKLVVP